MSWPPPDLSLEDNGESLDFSSHLRNERGMTTQDDFDKALKEVKSLSDLDNTELLQLYSLFKQATVGDVSGPTPGMFDLKGKPKYEACSEQTGLAKEQAMKKYGALVKQQKGKSYATS